MATISAYDPAGRTAGTEISSTYEGRHLTVDASSLTFPANAAGVVQSKDPVIVADGIVGVAFNTGDPVSVDTEGIWYLNVTAVDDDGNAPLRAGDVIYIDRTAAVLSKISNPMKSLQFGYALSDLTGGVTGVVAVKVHGAAANTLDYLGTAVAPYEIGAGSARALYLTSNAETGDVAGDYVSLALGDEADTDGDITGALASLTAPDRDAFGNMAAGASELVAAGAATDLSKAAGHGIHRFAVSGDATGAATAENVFTFEGLSATQFAPNTATATDGLRVIVNDEVRYIMLASAQS